MRRTNRLMAVNGGARGANVPGLTPIMAIPLIRLNLSVRTRRQANRELRRTVECSI